MLDYIGESDSLHPYELAEPQWSVATIESDVRVSDAVKLLTPRAR
jgi:hypothetical protein